MHYHLAQINIAKTRGAMADPADSDFTANLERYAQECRLALRPCIPG
ncbi:hypothetical protein ACFOW6_03510 [Fodinicurvata halophila]|uniref:Uncharacterized protein n=1 Tax=Fodinicurvata halophila TaxID=1419723 RepID=A0ABV8UIH6_9PROT